MNAKKLVCLLLTLITILSAAGGSLAADIRMHIHFRAEGEEPVAGDSDGGLDTPALPTLEQQPLPTATVEAGPSPSPSQDAPPDSPTLSPTLSPTQPPSPEPTATLTPSPTPTITPTPSPTPLIPYQIVITATDASIAWQGAADAGAPTIDENLQASFYTGAGEISADEIRAILLSYVFAVDELGRDIPVTVEDYGGFSPYNLGSFEVRYSAVHPESQEVFYASCFITVVDMSEPELAPDEVEIVEKPLVLDWSSNERYRKYLSYRDSIQTMLAERMDALNAQFEERVNMILSAFPETTNIQFARRVYVDQDAYDETAITQLIPLESPEVRNWSQVLPVYVANSSMKVNQPLDLYNLRSMPLDDIESVFWDMHEWSYEREGDTLTLILRELSNEQMIERYCMDETTVNKLDELMQPEFQMLFAALTKDDTFTDLSEETVNEIRATLPEGLNMRRETVVLTAHTLVGQLSYFWGGKYNNVGWNPLWGVDRLVESPNSETYGTVRPYGMDCSGFVAWVFINAAKDSSLAEALGTGTSTQWGKSRPLGWDEAEPGDIAFFTTPGKKNHVGVVVEKKEDGSYLVAHCSSSNNAVVITEAWSTGFRYMRRPVLYEGA